MRVIAGSAKGHKLKSLQGIATRPTSDKIKESLFNILSTVIAGSRFLDLYAGTGNIGIEALSRGADSAVFVEKSPQCTKIIKENLEHTKLAERAEIFKTDAIVALEKFATRRVFFDIIFVDPPYGKGIPDVILSKIDNLGILNQTGVVIVEKATKDNIGEEFQKLKASDVRNYGDIQLVFFSY